jgi:hypothetical protein
VKSLRIAAVPCLYLLGGLTMNAASADDRCQVAAYYFPNYHPDPRNEKRYGAGWTEWDLIRAARPRFAGHQQPKVPLWGYEDESDPNVMARKIDAAADHGVTAWIFDWYWHNTGPYIDRCLDKGFLEAKNRGRVKFALMWANHDWIDIFPAKAGTKAELLYPGPVTRETFNKATDYIIKTYFSQPNYWRIDGRPYFSIYELMTLVDGLGGVDKAREALDDFRARARSAGVGDLHLNAVMWGVKVLPNERAVKNPDEMLKKLGFDSVTSYCWLHHDYPGTFPTASYRESADRSAALWPKFRAQWKVPYFPNVSMGWDPSPRTTQTDEYKHHGYPFTPALTGNTPAEFKRALGKVKAFLDEQKGGPRIVTINAWNEWTEGSYLEPDTVNKMGYLEAIREVFGR